MNVLSCTEQSLQAACSGKAFSPPHGNEMQMLCFEVGSGFACPEPWDPRDGMAHILQSAVEWDATGS